MSVEPSNRAIVVLGMHRSGTSAFTGLLNLLGIDLGPKLMPATPDNESGYWEHAELVNLHDRLLNAAGSRWDDLARMPEGWWETVEVAAIREQIREIVARDFGGSRLWAIKDPRMCRLLPLWKPLLAELGITPVWVLMGRHPAQTIGSLEKRDGFSRQKSELLWLQHALEAEYHSREGARAVVTFDEFLNDWRGTLSRLEQVIGSAWPTPLEAMAEKIAQYVDPGKRHHRSFDSEALSDWTRDGYAALLAGEQGREEEMRARMDGVRAAYNAAEALYTPVVRNRAGELEQELEEERRRYATIFDGFQALQAKYRTAKEKLAGRTAELAAKKELLKAYDRSAGGKLNRLLGSFNKSGGRSVEPVHFPKPAAETPETTVIVSTGSDPARVAGCMRALQQQTAGKNVEVMAVADAEMAKMLKDWENIGVIEAGAAESFAEPQKRAAQKARGTYLIFMQDRVLPGEGWYEALIEPLRANPEIGMVGPEAGRVRSDGAVEMLPEEEGGGLQEADFCTTACLATPRHLFFQVGGFDGYYLPVEEAIYGLKIGGTRHQIWRQPKCKITRAAPAEGIDPKRFDSNWQRFAQRWPGLLEGLAKP